MSYRQVQQQKKEVRNSRGYRPINVSNQQGGGARRDLQQLKAETLKVLWRFGSLAQGMSSQTGEHVVHRVCSRIQCQHQSQLVVDCTAH